MGARSLPGNDSELSRRCRAGRCCSGERAHQPHRQHAGTAGDVLGKLPDFLGVPYGADARLLIDHGATPTVLYGPGDPNLAHAPDEHVALEDVARCARVLAVWLMRALA